MQATHNKFEIIQRLLEPNGEMHDAEDTQMGLMVQAIIRQMNKTLRFIGETRLSDAMIEETKESYNKNRNFYAYMFELLPEMAARTRSDYLDRFIRRLKKNHQGGNVLVGGSGNGRDVILLGREGFFVTAVDSAESMSDATGDWGGNVSVINQDLRDVNYFRKENFIGALVDSAFEHVNHEDVYMLVERFAKWLQPDGELLIRLKITESGQVYVVEDGVGVRWFSSWTMEQFRELIEYMKEFFYDIEDWETSHIETEWNGEKTNKSKKPNFRAISARRKP